MRDVIDSNSDDDNEGNDVTADTDSLLSAARTERYSGGCKFFKAAKDVRI